MGEFGVRLRNEERVKLPLSSVSWRSNKKFACAGQSAPAF
jgi:hypothetical protein